MVFPACSVIGARRSRAERERRSRRSFRVRAARSLFVATLACAGGVAGCGASKAATSAPRAPAPGARGGGAASAPATAASIGPARWFPVVDDAEPRFAEVDADGGRRVALRGLRLIEHDDGRIQRAPDLLPTDGPLGVVRLPSRLGSGFVFHSVADGATRLWRAPTWTSPLVPLVRLPFEASEVVAGFDRLLVVSARTRAVVGVDVTTGAMVPGGSLPIAPSYGGLAFSDGWLGAVEVDIRGALVTFDAGATFHAVRAPLATPGVFEQSGRVVLGTTRGAFALAPSGELERADGPNADAVFGDLARGAVLPARDAAGEPMDEDDAPFRPGAFGPGPLETAVLRGMPDAPGTALIVANGALARVSLEDGRIVSSVPHAVPSGTTCQAIPLFGGVGFVCGEESGPTTVYAFRPPLSLEPVLSFPGPRVVLPGGTGALAVRGGCPGAKRTAEATYCIVAAARAPREVQVRGDLGAERVVALPDGRAVVLVPPRLGLPGSVTVVGESASAARPLSLDAVPSDVRSLLTHGLWLDGFVETEPGVLSGWVAGSVPFVGVRVGLDGKVVAGTVRTGVERASLSATHGFVTDEHGGAYETTDGGMTWADVALPAAADATADVASERERGCTPVGCSIGSWVRVGWGSRGEGKATGAPDLVVAAAPPQAKLEPSPFVTWALECSLAGETEGPAQLGAVALRAPRGLAAAHVAERPRGAFSDLESSAFRPFLGLPSPPVKQGELAFDFGTEDQAVQLRGYAWGGRDAAWDRAGTWQVRVADRFAVRGAIWSTAPSRTPWADAAAAAEAFGSEPTHRISNEWSPVMDPVDDAGVVAMRTGPSTELAVIERDRAIVVVHDTGEFALDRLAGAVKVGGRFYLGTVPGPRAFQVLGIDGGSLSLLSSYPRYADDGVARVVRSVRGDALGIWVVQKGREGMRGGGDTWFVYPVDVRSGAADAPLVVPRDALSHTPRPCDPEEDGWVLLHEVSPSVTKLELTGVVDAPAVTHLEARLLASPNGLCLESLAAQVDGEPPKDMKSRAAASPLRRRVPLSLTDRATDRRWGFRCAP